MSNRRPPNKRIRKKLHLFYGNTSWSLGYCRVCGRKLRLSDFTMMNYCDHCGTRYYESHYPKPLARARMSRWF